MGMRVTTGMMMNTYRYNLQGSTSNLSDARNKVLTQRKFDSYAEDPASATMAWRIRRAMYSNADYQTNNKDTYSRFNIAWTTMGVVNDELSDKDGRYSTIRALTDSTAAGRQPLGQVLKNGAETIVQAMNSAKYGDHFVFAGNDEMNVPFSWNSDMSILYYRGVNVAAGSVERPVEAPSWTNSPIDDTTGWPTDMPASGQDKWEQAWVDYYKDQALATPAGIAIPQEVPEWTKSAKLLADGTTVQGAPEDAKCSEWDKQWISYFKDPENNPKPTLDPSENSDMNKSGVDWGEKDMWGVPANAKKILEDPASSPEDKAWAEYLIDQGDLAKLDVLAAEEQNVDLGMGLQEDRNGVLINGSAFNRSLPGINMLGGYGVDEDGDPRNAVLIMKRLGELCSACDSKTGAWASDSDQVEANRLLNKLIDARDRTTEAYDEIDTKGHFLQENQARLETQGDYLQEERADLEQVDLADAITEFSWDYYCYSAALKVGTQLLSQSLLDYMS